MKLSLLKLTAAVALTLGAIAFAQDESAALYKARCSGCHAADGSGKTAAAKKIPIPDLRSSRVQRQSDRELFDTIAYGKQHRSYPHVFSELGLSDPQIHSLVKHLRTLTPGRN